MYLSGVNNFQYSNYNTAKAVRVSSVSIPDELKLNKACISNSSSVCFTSAVTTLRTELSSNDEKFKYNELLKIAPKNTKKQLELLLKNGILLNSASNDNSTTLDNLYKIISTPRAQGLDNNDILAQTVTILSNPYTITQQFGNIPQVYKAQAADLAGDNSGRENVEHSGTCVAASIEFNLAQKYPAEFARFIQGLSSPDMSVNKTIQLKNLADNTLDAVWLLNAFEVPYKTDNFNEAHLTFAPDKNAIVRAHIQTVDKDKFERSSVDVLMQSTFMQIGSQQSYDSLTDKRAGKFNQNDNGLIEFEKTFTESVVENKNKISVTYQKVDEDARLIGYETDFDTMKKHITETLKMGENVIVGYTQVDNNGVIINGHEITITGVKPDKNGKLIFVCNDTDDNLSKPVEYHEDFILPKIHHAGLPQAVVGDEINIPENWVEGLKNYKELKNAA